MSINISVILAVSIFIMIFKGNFTVFENTKNNMLLNLINIFIKKIKCFPIKTFIYLYFIFILVVNEFFYKYNIFIDQYQVNWEFQIVFWIAVDSFISVWNKEKKF